jgi:hypothetical protein
MHHRAHLLAMLDRLGVPDLIDKSIDATHVAKDGKFRTDQAQKLIGSLGAGSIHDLYGSAALNNEIQTWVMQHSRLGIPVLFAEEGLHGFNTGTIFPAQINLAATWNSQLARQTSEVIAAEARSVRIDLDALDALDPGPAPELDPRRHYLEGPAADVAAYLLVLDTINFGSGWFPTLRKRTGSSGYFTVAWSLADRWRAGAGCDPSDSRLMEKSVMKSLSSHCSNCIRPSM